MKQALQFPSKPTTKRTWQNAVIVYAASCLVWSGVGAWIAHVEHDIQFLFIEGLLPWPGHLAAVYIAALGKDAGILQLSPWTLLAGGIAYSALALLPTLLWRRSRRDGWMFLQMVVLGVHMLVYIFALRSAFDDALPP